MATSSILCAAALAVSLLLSPGLATSRHLAQAAPSAVDVYNFALNLEYLEVSAVTFYRVDSAGHISSYLWRTLQAFKVVSCSLRCNKTAFFRQTSFCSAGKLLSLRCVWYSYHQQLGRSRPNWVRNGKIF